jgi:hypothetical protein
MKPSVKIIKRRQDEDSNELKILEAKKSVEPSTRELAQTVKCWITEFQQGKRAQGHSFPLLPVITTAASLLCVFAAKI